MHTNPATNNPPHPTVTCFQRAQPLIAIAPHEHHAAGMAAQRASIFVDRCDDVKPPARPDPVVHFSPMGKNTRGDATRTRILAELRRRRDAWEPELSIRQLALLMGIDLTATRYHLRVLRDAGLVHPDGVAITEAGMTSKDWGLTP